MAKPGQTIICMTDGDQMWLGKVIHVSELHRGGPDLPRARRRRHREGGGDHDDLHARAGRHRLAQEAPQE